VFVSAVGLEGLAFLSTGLTDGHSSR